MLLLGINKQLDLQTPFIALGKSLAMTEGWYAQRRGAQWIFIACLGGLGLALLTWTAWVFRHAWRQYGLLLFGLLVLIVFVLLRAAPGRVSDVLH